MLFHLALFQTKLFWLVPLRWHFWMASFPWCSSGPVNTYYKYITGFPLLVVSLEYSLIGGRVHSPADPHKGMTPSVQTVPSVCSPIQNESLTFTCYSSQLLPLIFPWTPLYRLVSPHIRYPWCSRHWCFEFIKNRGNRIESDSQAYFLFRFRRIGTRSIRNLATVLKKEV